MPKSLKTNAFFNFVKCLMNIVFPIISFPYASRILLPEGIGRVNFANSIIEYFIMLAEIGITTYAAREAAKIRDNREKLNKLAREIFSINIISTAVSYALLIFTLLFVSRLYEYRTLIIVCSTKVLFTTAGVTWLFTAMEDFRYITLRSIAFQILSLIFLFLFIHKPEDYLLYAAMGVFSNVGSNIINFVYSRKYINLLSKTKLEIKKHLKPIFVFFGISCAGRINNAIDSVMLGFIMGDIAVGFYSAAVKLCRFATELITSVLSSFMPRTSYYIENNLIEEYQKIVIKVFGVAIFFSLPAAAGLFMLCKPLIILFSGERYLPAVPAMRILSVGIIGVCMTSFLGHVIITPHRKEKFSLIAEIAAVAFNVSFNIVLIKKFGVFGAALATTIVEFLKPAVLMFTSAQYLKSRENVITILQSAVGTILMLFAVLFVSKRTEGLLLNITFSVVIGIIVYAASELALCNKTARLLFGIVTNKIKEKFRR